MNPNLFNQPAGYTQCNAVGYKNPAIKAIHKLTEKNLDLSNVPNPNNDATINTPTDYYTKIYLSKKLPKFA